jgi:hypothetical protein
MDDKSIFGHLSSLFTQGTDIFHTYKQMTPTKNDSNFDTLQYAIKHKEHTWKAFEGYKFLEVDTGIKDYGAQVLRHPGMQKT